ncbi:hypothetical protein AB0D33_16460 [Streptomyces sp. NPDC048404]|jgi:hypothetical protein|nr:hypothetical protein [Streptomyces sp. NBC_00151]WRZ37177.1 hypothetical protein OG915_03365 [Streptomyces sp. NBC_00151]
MALLAERHVTATPGRRVLEVYDADAFLGDSAALDAWGASPWTPSPAPR